MKAKAVLTLKQINGLLAGKSVVIRLPKQESSPAIELELSRERLAPKTRIRYSVDILEDSASSRDTVADLDMSLMDKAFRQFEEAFKTFGRIFRLPSSK